MFNSKTNCNMELRAVVIRKDGTREDLGVIARTEKKSLFRRILTWLTLRK